MSVINQALPQHRADDAAIGEQIRQVAIPLSGSRATAHDPRAEALDPLIEALAGARIVLLGTASHGTHEFYQQRAIVTTRLIRDLGFSFIAVEGDWPDLHAINRYVLGEGRDADRILRRITTFPTWMWANADMLQFVEWLRHHNDSTAWQSHKVGMYGLDLYSLYASMQAVVAYLEKIDPEHAKVVRERYACFDPVTSRRMLVHTVSGAFAPRENEAMATLVDLHRRREAYLAASSPDDYFDAVQCARAVHDAERYYRAVYNSDALAWNLRDRHMVDTLDALLGHAGPAGRAIVWLHNRHIGGAFSSGGERVQTVGEMVRSRWPGQSMAVGFGTYAGSVTSARAWGQPAEAHALPPAHRGSYDSIFHEAGLDRFLLLTGPLRSRSAGDPIPGRRDLRGIGVVYDPSQEWLTYSPTGLIDQFDAYVHVDLTRAIRPLRGLQQGQPLAMEWDEETFPTGY